MDNAANNLGSSPYLEPDANRLVFDRTDYWAKWEPSSVVNQDATNDRINFTGNAPIQNDMGGSGKFNGGDDVAICLKCGVDGSVGGDINRRSDCDLAINYLQGISASDLPLGGALFRRFYFYIPSSTTLPSIAIKLSYFHDASGHAQWTVLDDTKMEVYSGGNFGVAWTGVYIQKDKWYYIEEEFKRESSVGASDGEYKMWIAKDGTDPGNPVVDQTGLSLQQINVGTGMSIIGNWPHTNDASGYIYIDDISIANTRIQPVSGESVKVTP